MTLTGHGPFKQVPANRRDFPLGALQSSHMGDYLQTAHYVDAVLGEFLGDLKTAGLYDESVILIYGDHEGIDPALLDTVGEQPMATKSTRKCGGGFRY